MVSIALFRDFKIPPIIYKHVNKWGWGKVFAMLRNRFSSKACGMILKFQLEVEAGVVWNGGKNIYMQTLRKLILCAAQAGLLENAKGL